MKNSIAIVLFSLFLVQCSTAKKTQDPGQIEDYGEGVVLLDEGVKFAYPHWSPDGNEILYQADSSGSWQLYIAARDGSGIRRISDGVGNNYMADWSPDGAQIAFVSDRTGDEEVFVMNADGNNVRNLSNSPARDIHPYWIADGSQIFFNSTRDDSEDYLLHIYRMKPDGSELTRLTTGDNTETCAHLSPGGDRIVFLKGDVSANRDDICLRASDGSGEVKLTDDGDRDGWPSWSPDGSKVVFSTQEWGEFRLYVINPDGTGRKRLVPGKKGFSDVRAEVAPDGAEVIFNREKNDSTIAIMIAKTTE